MSPSVPTDAAEHLATLKDVLERYEGHGPLHIKTDWRTAMASLAAVVEQHQALVEAVQSQGHGDYGDDDPCWFEEDGHGSCAVCRALSCSVPAGEQQT